MLNKRNGDLSRAAFDSEGERALADALLEQDARLRALESQRQAPKQTGMRIVEKQRTYTIEELKRAQEKAQDAQVMLDRMKLIITTMIAKLEGQQ